MNRCPSCGGIVPSDARSCPNCGASNSYFIADASKHVLIPHTIEELKSYCEQQKIPLERMRFFVGKNYLQPKAYGIYRDGDRFIVYKNKSDGTRAIRYDGPDEAHAVSELFYKLTYECRVRGI